MMRPGFLLAVCALLISAPPAHASFHLMQIEQAIGGVGGDTSVQAVQLRMRSLGQNLVQFSRVRVWDAAGANPVIIFTSAVAVPNGGLGDRALIATASFAANTTPVAVPDFVMTNPIPASYLAAGSMTFENSSGTQVLWRLSWGGAGYTGLNIGAITNDVDGNFGPPFAGALPSAGAEAVLFPGAATALSTTNLADYVTTGGAAVFTNNAGANFTVNDPVTAVAAPGDRARLDQNTPNPFNPSTTITFSLERSAPATLEVYDARGRYIATLFEGVAPAGVTRRQWDGHNATGGRVGSGVYFYRLVTAGGVETRKMVLLK